tara:strand:- start:10046 stop:10231 length:186 start_codon:yes stop_codon:yes gene_type:complete
MTDVTDAIRELLDKCRNLEAENADLKIQVEGLRQALRWAANDVVSKESLKEYVKALKIGEG